HRALDIGKQCGDQFAFTVEILGARCFDDTNRRFARFLCQGAWSLCERDSTFPAEVFVGLVLSTASRTQAWKWCGAFRAKFAALAVVSAAFCALHVNSSSSAFASLRSAVSKPSVNQL